MKKNNFLAMVLLILTLVNIIIIIRNGSAQIQNCVAQALIFIAAVATRWIDG